jgi:hypothetical protein
MSLNQAWEEAEKQKKQENSTDFSTTTSVENGNGAAASKDISATKTVEKRQFDYFMCRQRQFGNNIN